ncbi:hypothetical protein GGR50DRAFT_121776 [Xylaria sp. CBS 124048]|nr:hypothetical protein GGR50DRAFT_121776 [Xylaria sp. CBS 124048]
MKGVREAVNGKWCISVIYGLLLIPRVTMILVIGNGICIFITLLIQTPTQQSFFIFWVLPGLTNLNPLSNFTFWNRKDEFSWTTPILPLPMYLYCRLHHHGLVLWLQHCLFRLRLNLVRQRQSQGFSGS